MQTSYTTEMAIGIAGMLADAGSNDVLSRAASGAVPIGVGLARHQATPDSKTRVPKKNYATLAFSADLVTSNSIVVTLNGTALAAVPFATDHLTTMNNIAAAIDAVASIGPVTVGGASNRSIFITGVDIDVTVSAVVTGGASQATASSTYATADVFQGVSLVPTYEQAAGVVQYDDTKTVNVMTKGRVLVKVEEAVTPTSKVFVRHTINGANVPGGFRASIDTDKAFEITSGARYLSSASAGGLAVLEVNLP